MFKTFITLLAILISQTLYAQKNTNAFRWGINGHPLTQAAYTNNWDDQLSRLKDLNLNSYRFDVLLDEQGNAKKENLFLKVLADLKKNNIEPLTVISLSGLRGLSNPEIYQTTFNQGVNYAKRYGDYVKYIEVNNEVDNKIMYKGDRRGDRAEDFDTTKTARLLTGIKGFIDGVKKERPDTKATLSVSYIHFYYLTLLDQYKVNYDIIGCHWYSNMGDITNFKLPVGNVLTMLSAKFNKPIWITEFNHGRGTTKASFEQQSQYITTTIPKVMAQNVVSGIFIYELYDQPQIRRQYPFEACYGLLQKDSTGNVIQKDAYLGYKQMVQRYK